MYEASKIHDAETIERQIKGIEGFLREKVDSTNPLAVSDRMATVSSYIALSGAMLADAKYLYNQVYGEAIKSVINEDMSASIMKDFAKAQCKDLSYLVDLSDRINRAATHELDSLRSILSSLKREMNI